MEIKKLRLALCVLFGTLSFGTLGYYFFEEMTLFDALYMTIITISTVGFAEIKPLTPFGRTITIFIIVSGISMGTYSIGLAVKMLVEGELTRILGRFKLEKMISELKNHFIICGYGRVGRIICEELSADFIKFVIIENDELVIAKLEARNYLYLQMDATSDEALLRAGIMNAKGIVTAVQSDADNVFISLTAKGLRPDVFILSRASDYKNEEKLIRAGSSRVVSPSFIGGTRMAQMLKRPTVVDFFDIAMMNKHLGLMMEEAEIGPNSNLIGKNLIDSHLRKDYGVIIVAIKKASNEMIFNPLPTEKLDAGDVLVFLGKKEEMGRMRTIL
jgi:voltage-gated potassium channel